MGRIKIKYTLNILFYDLLAKLIKGNNETQTKIVIYIQYFV